MEYILAWMLIALRSVSSASLPTTLAPTETNSSHVLVPPIFEEPDSFGAVVRESGAKSAGGHDIEIKERIDQIPTENTRIHKRFITNKNKDKDGKEKNTETIKHDDNVNTKHDSNIINIRDLENEEKIKESRNYVRREITDSNGFHQNDEDQLNDIKILDIADIIEKHHKTEMSQNNKSSEDDVNEDTELVISEKEKDAEIRDKIHGDRFDISKYRRKYDFIINHNNNTHFIDIKERHNSQEKSNIAHNDGLHNHDHHIHNKNTINVHDNEEHKQKLLHDHNKLKVNHEDESENINSRNNDLGHDLKKTEIHDNCDNLKEILKDIDDIINDDNEDVSDIIFDDDSKVLKKESNLKENKHNKEHRHPKSQDFNDSDNIETEELEDVEDMIDSSFEDDVNALRSDDKEIIDLVAKNENNPIISDETLILEPHKKTDTQNTHGNEEETETINLHQNHHHHHELKSHEMSKRNDEHCKEKRRKTFNLSFIFKK